MRLSRSSGTDADDVTYTYVYTDGLLTRMTKGDLMLYFTYDAAGTPMTVSLHTGTNCATGSETGCGADCKTYYYVTNLQGDVVAILDETGTVVVEYTYDAWGKLLTTEGTLKDTLGYINPLRYRGYVYDHVTGFYYLQSRYYDPEIGRFISADNYPSTGQGLTGNNMFAYCGNNPVARADEGGEFWNIVIGAAVGGLVSGAISLVTQVIENEGFENINWARVGVATAAGAVSGAFAATGIPVGGQTLINAAIGTISSVADTYVSKGESATTADYFTSAATGFALGAIGGYLGRDGSGTKHLSKSAGRLFKKVGGALGDVFDNGIRETGKTIFKAGKYYYSQIAKKSIQCGKKAIMPIIVSNVPNAVYNIWGALN